MRAGLAEPSTLALQQISHSSAYFIFNIHGSATRSSTPLLRAGETSPSPGSKDWATAAPPLHQEGGFPRGQDSWQEVDASTCGEALKQPEGFACLG